MSCENLDFPAVWPWAACAPKPLRSEGSELANILQELRLLREDLDQARPNEPPAFDKELPAISPPSAVPQKGITEAYQDESHVLR